MVNWKKLAKCIPNKVQIKSKTWYDILWVDNLHDGKTLGMMIPDQKQIQLEINQTDKDKVLTYLHECLHAFSDENNIGLTEKQVRLLETKMLYYWLKQSNLFNKE